MPEVSESASESRRAPVLLVLVAIAAVVTAASLTAREPAADRSDPNTADTPATVIRQTMPSDLTPRVSGAAATQENDDPARELFRGRVVKLRPALERRGIESFSEMDDLVALETPDGQLIPIVADWRGRAFYQDRRLRDRRVELIGLRREGVPFLQVVSVYTFDDAGNRQFTDYWCDICSIPMYEIRPCECCQGDIELRFQPQQLPERFRETAAASVSPGDVADGNE